MNVIPMKNFFILIALLLGTAPLAGSVAVSEPAPQAQPKTFLQQHKGKIAVIASLVCGAWLCNSSSNSQASRPPSSNTPTSLPSSSQAASSNRRRRSSSFDDSPTASRHPTAAPTADAPSGKSSTSAIALPDIYSASSSSPLPSLSQPGHVSSEDSTLPTMNGEETTAASSSLTITDDSPTSSASPASTALNTPIQPTPRVVHVRVFCMSQLPPYEGY